MAPRKKDKFQSSLQDDMNQQDSGWYKGLPAKTLPNYTAKKPKYRVVADEAERLIERSSMDRGFSKLQPSSGPRPWRRGRPVA